MIKKYFKAQYLLSDYAVLIYLAVFKVAIHVITNLMGGYGFFRDEFYYAACSDHLDFGYVDQPPLSILFLRFSRMIFGDSLMAIRLLPALAGGAVVLITGLMVKKMGGKRFAQISAALMVIIAPMYMAVNNYFSMNSFDLLFWAVAAYLIILIIQENRPSLWIALGIIMGLGLMNKISVLWLSFGLFLGLIISPLRRSLRTKWPWLAGIAAFLVFLPYLIWQVVHKWPTLEFIQNATSQKMTAISPLNFLIDQIILMHPVTFPLWVGGILYYFFYRDGRKYQILGIIYIVVLLILMINQKSRSGYLAPAYTMLFSSGAIVFERFIRWLKWKWIKPVFLVSIILAGIITAPLVLPVLPVEKYISYAKKLGQTPSTGENKEVGKLPQHYADMFGWKKMVATIAKVYQNLTAKEKSQTIIFAGNYGEAGAVDFFGKKYHLPKAISSHNNYWLWGPGERSGEVVIFFGGPSVETLKNLFKEVSEAAIFNCDYCMPYENNTSVYLCKKPKVDIKMIWPMVKHYE